MKQEILNLIDKVIGKKGIMRTPAWFVNKLFKKTLDYADKIGYSAMKYTDSRVSETEPYIIYAKKIVGDEELSYLQKQANKKFYDVVVAGEARECAWYNSKTRTWLTSTSVKLYPPDAANDYAVVEVSFFYGDNVFPPATKFAWLVRIDRQGNGATISSDEIRETTVVDSLNSESTTAALSANQGRVLNKRFCQLPSGLFNSDSDNWYELTAEEIDEIENTIGGAALYFINHKEGDTYTSIPLTFTWADGFFVFTGNQTRATTLDSGAIRITMTVWEFIFPVIYFQGYMKKTEKVIYEG